MKKTFRGLLLLTILLTSVNCLALTTTSSILDEVNYDSIDNVIDDLRSAHISKPIEEVLTIELDSPGGSVFAGFKLMNYIRALQKSGRKIDGIVTGICASMCFAILQTLDTRKAYPHAMLMQHLPSGGDSNVLEELERQY